MNKPLIAISRFKAARFLYVDLAAFDFAGLKSRLHISRLQGSMVVILQPCFDELRKGGLYGR
ncbi:MAG: hypothetical protein FWG94_09980 [Oscillospiraceae bacterium]|nr:hypothetical protein [Oscillospiraceae bacterium]